MTAGYVDPASGIRTLVLLLVLVVVLISLFAFGTWMFLGAQPEAQTSGSCAAVKPSVADTRE
jgi:hypothetical protein